MHPRRAVRLSIVLTAAVLNGCIHTYWKTVARPLSTSPALTGTAFVQWPVKAHLADGSTVLFRGGAEISARSITGDGESYSLFATTPTTRSAVPLDSVMALETFEGRVRKGITIVVSVLASYGAAVAGFMLLLTTYAITTGKPPI